MWRLLQQGLEDVQEAETVEGPVRPLVVEEVPTRRPARHTHGVCRAGAVGAVVGAVGLVHLWVPRFVVGLPGTPGTEDAEGRSTPVKDPGLGRERPSPTHETLVRAETRDWVSQVP